MIRLITLISIILLAGCMATGNVIVTGDARPATTPEMVKLYLDAPAEYETLGLVEASAYVGLTEQQAVDDAVAEMKAQAAKIGANGVILTGRGSNATSSVQNVGDYIYTITDEEKKVSGRAIYVNKE